MIKAFITFLLLTILLSIRVLANERHALLIGNQGYAYEVGPLQNPHNDVRIVGQSLAVVGFMRNITILKDASREAILTSVVDYASRLRKAGKGAVGFFYYSGHGTGAKGRDVNYLLPIGLNALRPDYLGIYAVELTEIISILKEHAPDAAHFIIFDACRNELQDSKSLSKGFVALNRQTGVFISFSTAPNSSASDIGDGSGPYAKALAAEIVKKGRHHRDMFQDVKRAVYKMTNEVQEPWERNGLREDIFFADEPQTPTSAAAAAPEAPEAAKIWESIKDQDSAAFFRAFSEKYPHSIYTPFAIARLQELQDPSSRDLSTSESKTTYSTGVIQTVEFEYLKSEYLWLYDTADERPDRVNVVDWYLRQLTKPSNRRRYENVSAATGVPWYVIGMLHALEGSFNFRSHLHNGDPLEDRTIHVPKGRPRSDPPFTWEQSAIDALNLIGWSNQTDWSLGRILHRFERYNGFGYRMSYSQASPYLWSMTSQYGKGKFVSSGVYDPNAVSKQAGAAAILKALEKQNIISVVR